MKEKRGCCELKEKSEGEDDEDPFSDLFTGRDSCATVNKEDSNGGLG